MATFASSTSFFRVIALAVMASLGGCASGPPQRSHKVQIGSISDAVVIPAGDRHLVMVRTAPDLARQGGSNGADIFCSEPAPDFATSFAAQQAASASATTPSGISASASGNLSQTATIVALAGRSAGIVALRDGLYQACQAYANGIISRGDYSLILSQYGDLLVALVGSSASSTSASAASAVPSATTSPVPTVSVAVAGAAAPAAPAATGSGTTTDTGKSSSTASPNPVVIQLANSHLRALLVSCLNAYDPEWSPPGSGAKEQDVTNAKAEAVAVVPPVTKPAPFDPGDNTPAPNGNRLLSAGRCGALFNNIVGLSGHLLDQAQSGGDPSPAGCTGLTPAVASPSKDYISAYQAELLGLKFFKGPVTGVAAKETEAALRLFQTAHHLCVTGIVDKPTAGALHLSS